MNRSLPRLTSAISANGIPAVFEASIGIQIVGFGEGGAHILVLHHEIGSGEAQGDLGVIPPARF